MTIEELEKRVTQLEEVVEQLLSALEREGTERDGNWGWESSRGTIRRLQNEMKD